MCFSLLDFVLVLLSVPLLALVCRKWRTGCWLARWLIKSASGWPCCSFLLEQLPSSSWAISIRRLSTLSPGTVKNTLQSKRRAVPAVLGLVGKLKQRDRGRKHKHCFWHIQNAAWGLLAYYYANPRGFGLSQVEKSKTNIFINRHFSYVQKPHSSNGMLNVVLHLPTETMAWFFHMPFKGVGWGIYTGVVMTMGENVSYRLKHLFTCFLALNITSVSVSFSWNPGATFSPHKEEQ